MNQTIPERDTIATALRTIHRPALNPWTDGDHTAHMHRTLELATVLLAGHHPLWAEVSVLNDSDGPAPFELVAISDDRVVHISGTIDDDGWPTGTVVPRSALEAIELHCVPMSEFMWANEDASVTLDYGQLRLDLPMTGKPGPARALAALVPILVADRFA